MKPWRRITGWLALLAVVLYGLTPAFACLAPGGAPLSCTTAQSHQCSCRPDPHGEGACCCSHENGTPKCSVGRLPCDPGTPAEVVVRVAIQPLALNTGCRPVLHLPRVVALPQALSPRPRRVSVAPLVPPPRLPGSIS